MSRDSLSPINFEMVSIRQLVTPTESLPKDHIPSDQLNPIAHPTQFVSSLTAERSAMLSSLVHIMPSLTGYVVEQVALERTELVEEEVEGVMTESVKALAGIACKEGASILAQGFHNDEPLTIAMGRYVLTHKEPAGSWRKDDDERQGILSVIDRKTSAEAQLYLLSEQVARSNNKPAAPYAPDVQIGRFQLP